MNSLNKVIENNKPKTKKNNKTGVTRQNYCFCPKVYVSQYGRSFKNRVAELCFNIGKTGSN